MGIIQFNKTYDLIQLKLSKDIQSPEIKTLNEFVDFSKQQWRINFGKFIELNIKESFQKCKKIKICILDLNYNQHSLIVKQITSISVQWINLKVISLKKNNIQSIQSLQLIKGNSLETLILDQNNITKISSLRKIFSQRLKYLSLTQNKLNEVISLQQIFIKNKEKFIQLNLDRNSIFEMQNIQKMEFNKIFSNKINCLPLNINYSNSFIQEDSLQNILLHNKSSFQKNKYLQIRTNDTIFTKNIKKDFIKIKKLKYNIYQ